MTEPEANREHDAALEAVREEARLTSGNFGVVLVALLLLFVLPLLLVQIRIYQRARQELVDSELRHDLLRARALAALVEREFIPAQKLLVSVADRELFRQAWAARNYRALERHLADIRKLEPALLFASVYELDGTMRGIVPPDPILGRNYAHRDWYRGVTSNWQPYISEVYRTAAAPNPLVVALAVPIRDARGQPIGILMAPYALEVLQKKFEDVESGAGGFIHVADKRGVLVAGPGVLDQRDPVRAPNAELVSRALAGREGSLALRMDGERYLAGYAPVARLGWAVLYYQKYDEALAAIARLRRSGFNASIYLLGVYLLTAGLAGILVRRRSKILAANQKLNQALEEHVAQLRKAQAELERTSREVQDLYDYAPCGYHSLDAEGVFLRVNETELAWLGYRREEMLGKMHFTDLLTPEGREIFRINFPVFKQRGWVRDLEFEMVRKDGSTFPVLLNASAVRDAEGNFLMSRSTVFDLTERKRAEAATLRAKEEAERVSKFKDQFLSTMSHELRTPLNAVLGFSELLTDTRYGTLSDRQRRYLEHIHTAGQHLLRLINDILDLSKIEAGRMEVAIEEVPAARTCAEVADALRPLAEKKSQTLCCRVPSDLPVRADATRLKQVLMNLAGNAIKFTPEGGRIELAARRDGPARVRIEVRDTGPGIPPEDQQRIFEAFCRLRKPGQAVEGTGLGLAITQRLVELQRGELGLESELGKGSCFFVLLPAARAASAGEDTQDDSAATRARPHILVIEDDGVAASLIESQLEASGYRATLCLAPERAVEQAAALQPAAITLDMIMKPKHGWEILSELKNDPRTAQIPVVVVSIVDQPAVGLALGADEYLIKPVEKSVLVETVSRCLAAREETERRRSVLVVEDDEATREFVAEKLRAAGFSVETAADGAVARERIAGNGELPALVILDLHLPRVNGFELLAEWRAAARTARLPVFVLTAKDLSREEEDFLRRHAESLLHKQQPWQETLAEELRRVLPARAAPKPEELRR
jgi:PAS domain S-box-containing protein